MNHAPLVRIRTGACYGWGLFGVALMLIVGGGALSSQSAQLNVLNVCHAGSVQSAFSLIQQAFTTQHPGVRVNDVSGGSVALSGRMAAGMQPCDVFAAADYLDIDLLLKPGGLADYTIIFAKGRMVLAYLATDPVTQGVAAAGDFRPPDSIPKAAPDWYRKLLEPGVRVAGSHPFLDPAGYRSHMMFQLTQTFYQVPNLSNLLLEHYTILPAVGRANAANAPRLGKDFNFQFTYEHSAAGAATSNPAYRYVTVPDRIDLSSDGNNRYYKEATVTIPLVGPPRTTAGIAIPATRVAWGLTIPTKSANREHAIAFVNLVLGATGRAALTANGPAPVTPAAVSTRDLPRLPPSVQALVAAAVLP